MKHILFVQTPENEKLWLKLYSSGYGENGYDECMKVAIDLPDASSWMIVAEKRSHMGVEDFVITNKEGK